MKKSMKKAISLVLTIALVVASFTGCGAKSKDTFNIGGIGPVTGDYAVYGQSVKNGAELAVKEINDKGGISGSKIVFNFEDDQASPEKSLNAYNTLKDKGMQILMGTVTSGACAAIIDQTKADGIFQLTPSASSTDVLKNGNVYQVCFTDPNQGIAAAQYIGGKKIASKIAIIYNTSDIYSSGIEAKFKEEAANQGLTIVAEETFTDDSKTDFSVQIQKAKDAGAELVFLPIYYTEASLILAQAAAIDYKPMYFGCDGLDGILTVENFDKSLAEGLMLMTPFSAEGTDTLTANFVTAYKAAYNDTPNQFAADGYDAIYIIKAAIEKSGAKTSMNMADMGAALKGVITQLSVDGLTGTAMTWAATGEVNKQPRVFKVANGAYAAAE